jgi:hypothetical protein
MAKKKEPEVYKVVKGCDTADGTRYEPGDSYLPELHSKETTKELLDAGAIDGDS